jgi:hypothetical protein
MKKGAYEITFLSVSPSVCVSPLIFELLPSKWAAGEEDLLDILFTMHSMLYRRNTGNQFLPELFVLLFYF